MSNLVSSKSPATSPTMIEVVVDELWIRASKIKITYLLNEQRYPIGQICSQKNRNFLYQVKSKTTDKNTIIISNQISVCTLWKIKF